MLVEEDAFGVCEAAGLLEAVLDGFLAGLAVEVAGEGLEVLLGGVVEAVGGDAVPVEDGGDVVAGAWAVGEASNTERGNRPTRRSSPRTSTRRCSSFLLLCPSWLGGDSVKRG